MNSLYSFKMDDITGKSVELSQYRGKVVLVVNVASKCGFTRQYAGLEELYSKYKDQGLVVLGFPANNFGGQEPGTDEQIKQFCSQNYGVTFPMFSKISVKGDDMHPLYGYLTATTGQQVKWNFNKFLVGKDGNVISKFESSVEPMSDELTGKIEELL